MSRGRSAPAQGPKSYTRPRVRPPLPPLLLLLAALAPAAEPDVPAPAGGPWRLLGAPREGEWRWHYPEESQTFAAYRESSPNRPSATRTTIYLQPFLTRPPRDPRLLDRTEALFRAFFGRPVKTLPNRPLPRGAWDGVRRQASVRRMLPDLLARLPRDALFLLAVTDRDLYLGRLESVFGWGSLELRVGVMSTWRVALGPDDERVRHRTATLAAHEACHMLSMPHCAFYACLMNGVRTLQEADARPGVLCPVCRAKLCWNLGAEPLARYTALERACLEAELIPLAREVRRAADVTISMEKG